MNENNNSKDQLGIDKTPFIGKDGNEYYSFQELEKANEVWFDMMFPKITDHEKEIEKIPSLYIGYDGKSYESQEERLRANRKLLDELIEKYKQQTYVGLDGKIYGSAQAKAAADIKYGEGKTKKEFDAEPSERTIK